MDDVAAVGSWDGYLTRDASRSGRRYLHAEPIAKDADGNTWRIKFAGVELARGKDIVEAQSAAWRVIEARRGQ